MITTTENLSTLTDFARHVRFSNPFEQNRISDAGGQPPAYNVDAIHAEEYDELLYLVRRVRGAAGSGAILWGEPGVGKSHLIARLGSAVQREACVTFLHNVQVRAERLPRYVLKTILCQLARDSHGSLHDGKLNQLLAATVKNAAEKCATPPSLSTIYQSYRTVYITPTIEAGNTDQEIAYEMLFAYFVAVYQGRRRKIDSPIAAEYALRWLTGDPLDADQIRAIGMPEKIAAKVEQLIPDDQGVEAVLSAIANLAKQADKTFLMLFDQVDNLNESQVSAWARFAHALIDHVPNLLVVTSGVRGRLLEMQDSSVVNAASWDRISQYKIDIGRISPEQARELLQTRLDTFLQSFQSDPTISQLRASDPLFPLGSKWFDDRIGTALELRPRDVINWAQARFRTLGKELQNTTPEEWLADRATEQNERLTSNDVVETNTSAATGTAAQNTVNRQELIDTTIEDKLIEQCRRRELNPETLPADAENLLGLTEQLLSQCIGEDHDYSLQAFERSVDAKKTPKPVFDLLVSEQTPAGEHRTTGVKFISTCSKVSAYASLRRIAENPLPPEHSLIVTESRAPLQLGPKGQELLDELLAQGEDVFAIRELSFKSVVELDALQALIGLARSGDIEIALPDGQSEPIDANQVAAAHHRAGRYLQHDLLRELLTEESTVATEPELEQDSSISDEIESFFLAQLSPDEAVSTAELTAKFQGESSAENRPEGLLEQQIERTVAVMHKAGKVIAQPEGSLTFVRLPKPIGLPQDTSGELQIDSQPARFTVSQVRQAAACPRLLHLDAEATRTKSLRRPRVTRIWQNADNPTDFALGNVFHRAVEKFTDSATRSKKLHSVLEKSSGIKDLGKHLQQLVNAQIPVSSLTKANPVHVRNLQQAIRTYTNEIAGILNMGLTQRQSPTKIITEVFGDLRRQVDVTFHVGPSGRQVHVTGKLDFVFYDWQRQGRRIIDYKLTPGKSVQADLFQVAAYALMHHQQHGSKPDAGLLYFYPKRKIVEMSWAQIHEQRHQVYDLLSSMVEWQDFQSSSQIGLHPPGNSAYCNGCRYNKECPSRLGPLDVGAQRTFWSDAKKSGETGEPLVQRSDATCKAPVPVTSPVTAPAVPQTNGQAPATLTVKEQTCKDDVAPAHMKNTPKENLVPCEPTSNKSPVESGLHLGRTPDGVDVQLPLDILPSHVAIVGAAGSGKTWMAKTVVEEAVRKGIPVLAIDPQGDLVQFIREAKSSAGTDDQSREDYLQRVDPRIYTPGSSHATRLSIDPIRFPSDAELQSIANPQRRNEERAGMLNSTISNLIKLTKTAGDKDLQSTFLLNLSKLLLAAQTTPKSTLHLRDLAAGVMAPDAVGMDNADDYLPKAQREKLGRKLRTLFDGPQARLFGGGQPLDIDAFCKSDVAGKTPLNVIYLNALANEDEKQFFVASLATELYRWMVTSKSSGGKAKLLVYIDEARDFAPAGGQKPPAKDPLIRLFSQGRKFGVAGLICTQSPRSVDYNIFSNCSTKLIGRLESAQDVDRVKEWFGNDGGTPPWLNQRKSADRGTFIARWPGIPSALNGKAFKGRPLYSLHEGAWSPSQVEEAMQENQN